MPPTVTSARSVSAVRRVRFLYAVAAFLLGIFLVRLFYLQIIRHDFYRKVAASDQLREYQIPATRGVIMARNGDELVPIVLNQKLYTLYADPVLVKDARRTAETLRSILGGKTEDYIKELKTPDTRYVVLAKKADAAKKDAVLKHKLPGIGAQEMAYRTYPNGMLASQLLGFVNDDGEGAYGVEQALNKRLSGTPGELKAVTDVNGVPLAASTGNVRIAPKAGDKVVLTIDVAMQKQLETILKQGLQNAKSESGSALIMNPNTGAVKAMANWPTYDPGNYAAVTDGGVFNNPAVSSPLEVGSIMKPLTAAAALDQGAVRADSSYDDPAQWTIDGYKITNIEEDGGPARRSVTDILNFSLNTGATWLLMQMGKPGGTEITREGREKWHDYMVNHYRLGRTTGIEQGYEAPGSVPHPTKGYGRDLTYANSSFGQGMSATPIQMAAAFSAMINGGTYFQPRLADQFISPDGKVTANKPKVLKADVVSPQVSRDIQHMLEYVVAERNFKPRFNQQLYSVGGKTGTAQIADPTGAGGYKEHDFNGTYLGFVGGDKAQYVIMVRVNEPKIGGYAGSAAAQPIFGSLAHMLIDNFGVAPKR
ncbi:MAG TPA: penicillin-binding protein 2 [Candidatus Saccharimonadales bacterium]|nr:penicillin-binding protein 2 [Candidatus Saccharimonadales bacterium]